METFRKHFTWSNIEFTLTLQYASSVNNLTLLNENTTASLKKSKYTKTSTGYSLSANTDSTISKTSADSNQVICTTTQENAEMITLHLIITYVFTVTDQTTEAENLSSYSSSNIFSLQASAKEGS